MWVTAVESPLRGVKKISECIMIAVQQIGKENTTATKCHQRRCRRVSVCCGMLMTPSAVMTTHTMQHFPKSEPEGKKKNLLPGSQRERKK